MWVRELTISLELTLETKPVDTEVGIRMWHPSHSLVSSFSRAIALHFCSYSMFNLQPEAYMWAFSFVPFL